VTLNLRFEEQEGNKLKLVWMGDNWSTTYSVRIQSVKAATDQLRQILDQVSEHYRTSVAPDYSAFLTDLAATGAALADSLFDNIVDGDPAEAAQARQNIFDTPGRQALNIYSDMSVHVPWGFAFEGDPWQLPDPTRTPADFACFWLNRFNITVRCNSAAQLRPSARPKETFRVLYALHKELHQAAVAVLPAGTKEKLDDLLAMNIGTSTDWVDCREKWERIVENDSIFYIFGHSDGQSIALSPGNTLRDRINTTMFRSTFKKKHGSRTATICFVNGCGTARGILDASFLNASSGPGYYGFIGTEAELSNEFATIYGMEFMGKMCRQGRSVQEAFEELRTELFPLSLFYACFAHPDFRVADPHA
jgi:hypothetical protein